MSDTTELLLKVSTDIDAIKKIVEGFKTLKDEAKRSEDTVKSLGQQLDQLRSSGIFALGAAFKFGAVSVEALTDKIKEAVTGTTELAHQMKEVERATGLAGEATQVLTRAGKVTYDELTTKLQRYRAVLGEALIDKGSAAAKLLSDPYGLNLDPKTLSAAPMVDQLKMVADAFGKVTDGNEQARYAMELFGRNSGPMLVLLNNLRTQGYDKMAESVRLTAGILGDDMEKAILKQERAASAANNRLAISFGDVNLKMLKAKTAVAEMLADNATALSAAGQSLALVGGALGVVTALKAIPWAALGTAGGSLMGPALGVAVAGALVIYIGKAMEESIAKANTELDKSFGKNIAHKALDERTRAGQEKNIKDAERELEVAQITLKVLEKQQRERAQIPRRMGGGDSQDETDQLQNARLRVGGAKATVAKASKLRDSAGQKEDADDVAMGKQMELDKAKEISAELLKQEKINTAAKLAHDYLLAVGKEKLTLLTKEDEKADAEYKTDMAAAALVENRQAVESAALAKLDAVKSGIDDRRKAALKEIAEIEAKATAAKLTAFRAELEGQKLIMEAKRNELVGDLADLDAQYWRTDKEKWAEKNALQLKLVKTSEDYLVVLQKIRAQAPSGAEKQLADQSVQGATKDVTEAKRGAGANAGKNPSTPVQMREQFKQMREGFIGIAHVISGTMQSAIDSISNSMTGLVMGTMTWGAALANIGTTVLQSVVSGIAKMFAQWVVGKIMTFVLDKSLGAASAAASIAIATPTAMALTALWVGPATLASIASFGAADVAGTAGLEASMLTTKLMSLGQFASGGYTGAGGVNQVAGIVHAGEVVYSQRDVARAGGVAAVERMRTTGGNSSRGAGMAGNRAGSKGGPVTGKNGTIHQAFFDSRASAEQFLASQNGRKVLTDLVRQQNYEM